MPQQDNCNAHQPSDHVHSLRPDGAKEVSPELTNVQNCSIRSIQDVNQLWGVLDVTAEKVPDSSELEGSSQPPTQREARSELGRADEPKSTATPTTHTITATNRDRKRSGCGCIKRRRFECPYVPEQIFKGSLGETNYQLLNSEGSGPLVRAHVNFTTVPQNFLWCFHRSSHFMDSMARG